MDLTIFIPTIGRTSMEHITINEMKKFSTRKPFIVCPQKEVFHYSNYTSANVLPCPMDGIGPTRQFIIENSPTRGVVMLDDDMYFSYRPIPDMGGAGCLERIQALEPLFNWISTQLDNGYMHGGISARQGNQNIERESADCIRVNNAHFFDRDMYLNERIRFDQLPVMEDFHVTLTLLLRGYPNRVAYHYCWSQRGSGTKGGCSLYRTAEVQTLASRLLYKEFPEYVRLVQKTSDSQSGVMAARDDVNISWLKAWADRKSDNRLVKAYVPAIPDLARR